LEADVSVAQLLADHGQLDEALALAERAAVEAGAGGSSINEGWARSVLAHLPLPRDGAPGLGAGTQALAAALALDYPAAVSVNLRSLAWGRLRHGDPAGAADALAELFDGLLARAGVADLRGALYTTAELLHVTGSPAWEPIAATAAALPAVGLM